MTPRLVSLLASVTIMTPLTTELRADLVEALAEGFDLGSLKMVVRFSLGERLEGLVGTNKPLPQIVFDVIDALEQRGTVGVLLRGVLKARPPPAPVGEFCRDKFPDLADRPEVDGLIRTINSALRALIETAADPQVRLTIGGFRANFGTASDRIKIIKGYKGLHDSLHQVQLQLPTIVESASRARPGVLPGEWLNLARYARQLRREVLRARENAKGLPTVTLENRWVDEFDEAVQKAEGAIAATDTAPLQISIEDFRGILGQAPRINGQLSAAAADMRLDRLIDALDEIKTRVSGPGVPGGGAAPDSATLDRLENGFTALRELRPRLASLVEEHSEWQWLDAQFAAADLASGHTPAEKVPKWLKVEADFDNFCRVFTGENWSGELTALAARWKGAADPNSGDAAFNDFRFAGVLRFFDVDTQLMDLCGRLTEIAAPLDILLELVANDRSEHGTS